MYDYENKEFAHLRIMDLNTRRGWLQLVGALAFVALFFVAASIGLGLIKFLMVADSATVSLYHYLAIGFMVFLCLPVFLFVRAVRCNHMSNFGMLFWTLTMPPIGMYFFFLRGFDRKLIGKEFANKIEGGFVVPKTAY